MYEAREILAAQGLVCSLNANERKFAKEILNPNITKYREVIDITSIIGLEGLMRRMPHPSIETLSTSNFNSRIMTAEEFARYLRWSRNNDKVLKQCMYNSYAEVVYNPKRKIYQLAHMTKKDLTFKDIDGDSISRPFGALCSTREVVEVC